ncbi:MAG: nitronate monooxygenase, partial [Pseudomonadales bacterium]
DDDAPEAKDYSRRDFIQKGTLATIATATMAGSSLGQAPARSKPTGELKFKYPSKATKRLTELLGIQYPIIQAPTGGIVNSSFSAAVAKTGCLGALPLSWSEPADAIKKIEDLKSKTDNSFFANFVLNFEPKAFDAAVESGVPIIQFSWGMPSREMVAKMKEAKVVLGIQVTSETSAKTALDLGADYLVCQGTEAGG